jgi:hypothetical protein
VFDPCYPRLVTASTLALCPGQDTSAEHYPRHLSIASSSESSPEVSRLSIHHHPSPSPLVIRLLRSCLELVFTSIPSSSVLSCPRLSAGCRLWWGWLLSSPHPSSTTVRGSLLAATGGASDSCQVSPHRNRARLPTAKLFKICCLAPAQTAWLLAVLPLKVLHESSNRRFPKTTRDS